MEENAILDELTHQQIKKDISDHKILLYMKGTKDLPMCGFSSTVVDILNSYSVDFHTVNVLDDPNVRRGIKIFSDWPTIPQLYVNGTFIGGCDIVIELHEGGELQNIVKGS